MTARLVLGVDLGVSGALALVAPGDTPFLLEVVDAPVLDSGPGGRRTLNAALLADIVRRLGATDCFAEHIGPMPRDGAVGAFAFGRSRGQFEGVAATLGLPVTWLTTPAWRRAVGLPPGASKDQARAAAIARWPSRAHLFARKRDDGRAEAALIAVAGLAKEARS